jgi:hypothetical protein
MLNLGGIDAIGVAAKAVDTFLRQAVQGGPNLAAFLPA